MKASRALLAEDLTNVFFTQTTSVSSEAWVLSYLNVGGFRKNKNKTKGKNKNKTKGKNKNKNKKDGRWPYFFYFICS